MEGRYERYSSEIADSSAISREIGTLTQPSDQESNFLGSSSGVYFINTVKRAFATSGSQCRGDVGIPAAEQTVGGEDDHEVTARNAPQEFLLSVGPRQNTQSATSVNLGPFPSYEKAQQYAVEYFARWHPLFPFLCGPTFLRELQYAYQSSNILNAPGQVLVDRKQLCNLIIIRCVLMIGAQHAAGPGDPAQESPSRSRLLSNVCVLASRHDLLTLQTILAAQLYCVSTLALRTASTLSGLLARLLVHAGLHRCPYRYDLSDEQRNLRKRIFWCFFSLDRYLCVSLGVPVALVDSDIDVCVSGRREIHVAESPAPGATGAETYNTPDSADQGGRTRHVRPYDDVAKDGRAMNEVEKAERGVPGNREETLACLVEFNTLIGRALELFHKSIHVRHYDPKDVLYLRSDVEKWFNGLPSIDSLDPGRSHNDEQTMRFLPFFHVMYERITIAINRPALSLPRSLPEFHHSLQVTIRAAKNIISGLEKQSDLFWPGYLASVWMSDREVQRCLALLGRMGKRWNSVQHCYSALSELREQLRQPRRHSPVDQDMHGPSAKRTKRDVSSLGSSTGDITVATENYALPDERTSAGANHDWTATGQDYSATQNLDLDMNDFFQDLSWDNLFENGGYANQDGFLFEY